MLRHKFYSLQEGHVASDAECAALLRPAEGAEKPLPGMYERRRPKHRKHNLAKGALRPEDAAVRFPFAVCIFCANNGHVRRSGCARSWGIDGSIKYTF